MTRFPERASGFALALAALAAVLDLALVRRTGLQSAGILPALAFWSFAVSLLVLVRFRLARLAFEEKQDDALAKREGNASLFAEEGESDAFSMARSRDQFERYFVPATPILIAVAFALLVWKLGSHLDAPFAQPRDHLLACAMLVAQAFFFFLLGRYLLALARAPEHRMLRGPGITSGLISLAALLAAAASAISREAWPPADAVAARVLLVFLALLAMESLLAFIMALYSPRRRQTFSSAYESRIAAALTDPSGWSRGLAQALDYQFGFKISETGLYRSLSRVLLPLLAAQLLLLYCMSCFVFLGPEEEGIRERFGKPLPDRWHLEPGFHLKRPWPFETVRRFPVRRILLAHIGYEDDAGARRPNVLLWTIPHYRSEDVFVTPGPVRGDGADSVPVNLVSMNIPIEYRITDLYRLAYEHADPETALRDAAYRTLTRATATRDIAAWLGDERAELSHRLQQELQAECDRLQLGVRVEFISLAGVHPPVPIAPAFQSVVGAMEEREAAILMARAYAGTVKPVAESRARQAVLDAEAYRARRRDLAAAEAEQFRVRLLAYRQSPAVFRSRAQLDSLRRALADSRKFILDGPDAREVLYFNFEEKENPDLFDLSPASSQGARP